MPKEMEFLFLLDIIGHKAADHKYYSHTSYYHVWKTKWLGLC